MGERRLGELRICDLWDRTRLFGCSLLDLLPAEACLGFEDHLGGVEAERLG